MPSWVKKYGAQEMHIGVRFRQDKWVRYEHRTYMGYTPHVVVVGGGAIGTATARDLAMRGLEVTLVERGTLAAGATGTITRHLESGIRAGVSSTELARQRKSERETVRDIAGHCTEETGALFIQHARDEGATYDRLREVALELGLEVDDLTGDGVRAREPALSDKIDRGFEVPGATIDPGCLAVSTARSADNYGATVRTRTTVTDVLVEDGAVQGIEVETPANEHQQIQSDYIVNATGARAGTISQMAGIDLELQRSRGLAVVHDGRPTTRIVERSVTGTERDILLPAGQQAVLGWIGDNRERPGNSEVTAAEIDQLLDSIMDIVPSIADGQFVRADPGIHVCGLAGETEKQANVAERRQFTLLDHESRDGTWGISTVLGGTLTTHRLAAERIADHVCEKFGIRRPSQTASTPLPGSATAPDIDELEAAFELDRDVLEATAARLGERTERVLDTDGPNPVVCDCVGVTRAEVKDALADDTAHPTDLQAVRLRTGAGTGPCQGGRCVHRLAAQLYLQTDEQTIDSEVETFYQDRWDGRRHVLWGDQLAQAMESYALHATTMNRATPPGEIDFDAFDSGPEWDEDELDRYGGFAP